HNWRQTLVILPRL
ncbi:endogenous retrovirus group K member 19 Env polyprotein-like, partial [Daubentonia madagascariensis]